MNYSVTAIVPVMNETFSLRQTCEILINENSNDLKKILIVSSPRTSFESKKIVSELLQKYQQIQHFCQTRPFVGGAYQDGIDQIQTTHFVMLSSDLETNPQDVATMIDLSKKNPQAIIAASRWTSEKGFTNYSPIKLVLNYIFQKIFSNLYNCDLSDMTYGFRLFPTTMMQSIRWDSLKHPFFFESLLKPLRLGCTVIEVSSNWKARQEGESQNTFWKNFEYFGVGLRLRFSTKNSFLRAESEKQI